MRISTFEVEACIAQRFHRRLGILIMEVKTRICGTMLAAQPDPMPSVIRSRVLVVDDHQGVAARLGELVERAGFDASFAFSGAQGVMDFIAAQSAGTPFAAVITDFSMADLDGLGVAAAVKTSSPSTGVILLTAYATDTDARPPHVDAMLSKPPSFDDLQATLSKLIDQELMRR